MAFVGGLVVGGRGPAAGAEFQCRRHGGKPRVGGVRMDMEESGMSGGGSDASANQPTGSPTGELSSFGLLRSDVLQGLRVKYMRMQSRLNKLVKEEKYLEAAKVRDDMSEIREMDPVLKYEKMLLELKEAEKEEDYQTCIKLRNEMNEIRPEIPHLNLSGLWKGNQGDAFFRMEGLKMIATRAEDNKLGKKGEKLFEADMSFRSFMEPQKDKKLELILKVIPGMKALQVFHGRGIVIANGSGRQMDGFFVLFKGRTYEKSVCAFIFPEIALVVLFQRDKDQGRPQRRNKQSGTLPDDSRPLDL